MALKEAYLQQITLFNQETRRWLQRKKPETRAFYTRFHSLVTLYTREITSGFDRTEYQDPYYLAHNAAYLLRTMAQIENPGVSWSIERIMTYLDPTYSSNSPNTPDYPLLNLNKKEKEYFDIIAFASAASLYVEGIQFSKGIPQLGGYRLWMRAQAGRIRQEFPLLPEWASVASDSVVQNIESEI